MIKLGKFRAGLFCGSKWYPTRAWKVEGVKLRIGSFNYRVHGTERGFLLGLGPFIFWMDCAHENLRCLHGKEFNDTERRRRGGIETARLACVDCGHLIYDKPRPLLCTDTGFTHSLSRL